MSITEKLRINTKIPNLYLTAYRGHFVTGRSHMNYYIDITTQKSSLSEAKAVAKVLAENYKSTELIDTVLCLDGTEVIGTCLADYLTRNDFASINANQPISICTPEFTQGNRVIFRDNTVGMVSGRRVLILAASVATGSTARTAIEAIEYYGGEVAGISSIFATVSEVDSVPVSSVFNPTDLNGYGCFNPSDCPMCRQGERIEALINSFGCSVL